MTYNFGKYRMSLEEMEQYRPASFSLCFRQLNNCSVEAFSFTLSLYFQLLLSLLNVEIIVLQLHQFFPTPMLTFLFLTHSLCTAFGIAAVKRKSLLQLGPWTIKPN